VLVAFIVIVVVVAAAERRLNQKSERKEQPSSLHQGTSSDTIADRLCFCLNRQRWHRRRNLRARTPLQRRMNLFSLSVGGAAGHEL
jgi:hypothetical protein